MSTEVKPAAETILAVFAHETARMHQIEAALKDCRPKAYSSAFTWFNADKVRLEVSAKFSTTVAADGRPNWMTERCGDDFDALCDQVLADIAAYKADMFGTEVERMALAIIQIKHREGAVTDRALRLAHFTQEVIEAVHERAVQLANEMSDGKPFEVEFVGAGNHAEAV